MNLVFDTTVLAKMLDNNTKVIKFVSEQDYNTFTIPLACDSEIRFGYNNGSRELINLTNYEQFKNAFGAIVYIPTEETSKIYAELTTFARKNGIVLSNNDLWIAASSLEIGGKLITLDKDFTYLPQIRCAYLKLKD
jgi:predicted nucleic acid-binding protein